MNKKDVARENCLISFLNIITPKEDYASFGFGPGIPSI